MCWHPLGMASFEPLSAEVEDPPPIRHFRLIYVFAVLNQKVKRNAASTRAGYAFPAMACWSLLCACRVFAEHVGEIRTGDAA